MISKNAGFNALYVLSAIFGIEAGKAHLHSASVESFSMDRYGMKMEIVVYGVASIVGRYSKDRNFNGVVVFANGKVKHFRSANAFKK